MEGSVEVKRQAFQDIAVVIKRCIDIMLSLPLERLNRLAIQKQVRDISTQCPRTSLFCARTTLPAACCPKAW